MRILLLNQFYPPDVAPTGQFLHDLARTLARRGHEVQVFCSRRSYDGGQSFPPEQALDGVRVHRLPALGFGRRGWAGTLADYASFLPLLAARALLCRPRPDLVLVMTTPPYVGLVAAAVARLRSSTHAHWVMDLYPDVLVAHGMLRENGLAYRILRLLTRAQLRGAKRVVALGPFMARRLEPYAGPSTRTDWIPLWGERSADPSLTEAPNGLRHERGWRPEDLVLLYSGNMGLGHRFGEFLAAAARLGPRGPVWAFAGGGKRRGEIESFARSHPEARIELLPYVPRERLGESLSAADVHLASLSQAWQGLIVPSKVQAGFCAGRPVIFVGPRENEIASWIEESGGGWVVGEGDVDGLAGAVVQAHDPRERAGRAAAALTYAHAHFDPVRNCERLALALEECGRAPS